MRKSYVLNIISLVISVLCFYMVLSVSKKNDTISHNQAFAHCDSCNVADCLDTEDLLVNDHFPDGETFILSAMREDFHLQREFIVRKFFEDNVLPALMLMTEQMSNVATMQMESVGEFFDAKLHLEAQRLFNELQNEANRDYYPSESFCWFGTNARSLAASERLSNHNKTALNNIAMTRQLGTIFHSSSFDQTNVDKLGRWKQFIADNCDPQDNGWYRAGTGLSLACSSGASDSERTNRDIAYTRFIDDTRTLDVDFRNATPTTTEEDIMLMSSNLYGHDVPVRSMGNPSTRSAMERYISMRSVMAKRHVAQNTFSTIVGLKSSGSGGGNSPSFLKAIVKDLGLSDADIEEILGDNPSYYAQLEVLSQKMFQTADFFTDLYDKPANVDRKLAALNAIELMLDRAIYESELRHEMLYSVLLSSKLDADLEETYGKFLNAANTQIGN